MSSLADFVNEHRSKLGASSRPTFSMANVGTKVTSSFSGLFKADNEDDKETLTDNPTINGQLPSSRNRRPGTTGWFGITVDEGVCGLTRFQRMAAMMLLPILIIQTRKFATLNTLGSLFFIISFGFLWGPMSYINFLFSPQRRIVTITYVSTVLLTLYTSLWLQNTILTIFSSGFQAMALLWYLLSFIPGGETGLKFMTKTFTRVFCSKQSSKLVLPI